MPEAHADFRWVLKYSTVAFGWSGWVVSALQQPIYDLGSAV
jgi:hypothetical protein